MRIYEEVIKIKHLGARIRVWRQLKKLPNKPPEWDISSQDIHFQLTKLYQEAKWNALDIAETISKLPRVNAVEVGFKGNESSILIYPEWP